MKNLFGFLIMLSCVSCCRTQQVYYEYGGVTITQIDHGSTSRFYYGKYENNKSLPQSYVETWSTGRLPDSGKVAFVIFRKDNVALYCPAGGSVKRGEDPALILYGAGSDSIFDQKWWSSIEKNYNNIARVCYDNNDRETDLAINKTNNSLVEITYSISK